MKPSKQTSFDPTLVLLVFVVGAAVVTMVGQALF